VSDGGSASDAAVSGGSDDASTADTMRERAGKNRFKLWLLLDANRLAVAAVLAVTTFAALVTVGQSGTVDLAAALQRGDTKATVFSTLLGAIITATTLVVTISQVVISQENGPLGDQHERMSDTLDVREYASELTGEPVPSDPAAFLGALVDETDRRARALQAAAEGSDAAFQGSVAAFVDSVTDNADAVNDRLAGAQFGNFDVLSAALDFNYGAKIIEVEQLRHDYTAAIDNETDRLLSDLRTVLSLFGPVREHVKTLYFQWALVDLSQLILYAAVPALVVAGGMLAFFGSAPIPGTTLGVANVLWVVAAGFTVCVFPFLLLVSYVARIATVAKRTLAIGPLVLRDSN
jgi:hypothetical protein